MCGIAGIAGKPENTNLDTLRAMCRAIEQRGPDDHGMYSDTSGSFSVALGSQRLSIVDLSQAGHMPMLSADGQSCIVYNGELYNHELLRTELVERGYIYHSKTDTETVLYAFKEWGVACLERFNGIFAFAIYDRPSGQLLLARDRLGIKPLYYRWDGSRLIFASELKAIEAVQDGPGGLSIPGLNLYLNLGYLPSPYSLLEGVEKLKAGHYLQLQANSSEITVKPYWQARFQPPKNDQRSEAVLIAQTRQAVEEAVRGQLMSDVPVGVLLSGGLDSSIVAAVAQKYSSQPIDTFSIGFHTANSQLEAFYNHDREAAAELARQLGTRHHEIILEDDADLLGQLRELTTALDEPVWEPSYLSIYLLCKLARQHGIKVVLTGDGSDELWGGYNWYEGAQRLERYERLPFLSTVLPVLGRLFPRQPIGLKAKDLLQKYRQPSVAKYVADYAHLSDERVLGLLGHHQAMPGLLARHVAPIIANAPEAALADQLALADLVLWVGEHFNQRLDRMSMLASVEARVPFQDNAVVDLALTIPMTRKIQNGVQKHLLREAFKDMLPASVLNRPKRPFAAPAKSWLQGQLKPYLQGFESWSSVEQGLFDPAALRALVQEGLDSNFANFIPLWIVLSLELWQQNHPSFELAAV